MIFLYSFIFCGIVCLIGQIILDNTNLTPGHVTSLFVVIGAFLDSFGLYDKFISWFGSGVLVPITSFGHSLIHGALQKAETGGLLGLLGGMFNLTSVGIVSAIVFGFIFTFIFKAKD